MTARVVVLFSLVLAAVPAFAQKSQQAAEIQALRTYYKADVERLCPKVEPGGGRLKACLSRQKEKMTVGCAQALQKLQQSRQ